MRYNQFGLLILILAISTLFPRTAIAQIDPGVIGAEKSTVILGLEDVSLKNVNGANLSAKSAIITWQRSYDNSSWASLINSNNLSGWKDMPEMTGVVYYRRVGSVDNSTVCSNTVEINVLPVLDPGVVTGSQKVVSGTQPASLNNSIAPIGGTGSYTFQWESSNDEFTWATISGATGSSYQPGVISKNQYYRRKTTSGNQQRYSNVVQIYVSKDIELNSPDGSFPNSSNSPAVLPTYSDISSDNLRSATEITLLRPNVNWNDPPFQFSKKDYEKSTTYFDGISRPIQSVDYKASISEKDVIKANFYDEFGNIGIDPLSYIAPTDENNAGKFRTDVSSQQPNYFNSFTQGKEDFFYNNVSQEKNLLPRYSQRISAGKSYAGNQIGSKEEYRTNDKFDNVRIWKIGDGENDIPYSDGAYEVGKLLVKVSTNANDAKTYEYADNLGRIIMRSVLKSSTDAPSSGIVTYYVYDDMGHTRYVITPLAVKYCQNQNDWTFSGASGQDVLMNLCYKYVYDKKGRIIISQAPGLQGPSYMVYDSRDRLVFLQDVGQRSKGQGEWMLYFYDGMNRQVMTALYKNSTATRTSLQSQLDNVESTTGNRVFSIPATADLYINNRDATVKNYGATNSINFTPGFKVPAGSNFSATADPNLAGTEETVTVNSSATFDFGQYEPVSITYYDNYNWKGAAPFSTDYVLNAGSNPYPTTVSYVNTVAGNITGTKVKVIGENKWLTSTYYYDVYNRNIQTREDNISGGENITTAQFDFSGKILSEYFVIKNSQAVEYADVRTQVRYEYENAQIAKIYHSITHDNVTTEKLLAQYLYDDWGHLIEKDLSDLETLKYDYNLKGQLTGINAEYAKDKSTGHYFGMELFYNNGFKGNRYDGRLSGVTWRRKGSPDEWNSYGYSYNSNGSVARADYTQNASGNWSNNIADYKVSGLEYDDNGNVLKMKQDGMLPGGVKAGIDDLQYTNANAGYSNQLKSLSDNSGNQQQGDFADKAHQDIEYEYDINGNLTKDKNKGITIESDLLINKPTKISIDEDGKNIRNVYDVDGNRLKKVIDYGDHIVSYTYINGFVYRNDSLLYFSHPEGRVRKNANNDLVYDYYITDQQGNTRTVITEDINELSYKATHEASPDPAPSVPEKQVFTFPAYVDDIPATNKFYDYNGKNRQFVRLNSNDADRKVGTSKVLRVMAGDAVNIGVMSYYVTNSAANNQPDATADEIVNQLVQSLLGTVTVYPNGHDNIVESVASGNQINKDDLSSFVNDNHDNNLPSAVPKAYLNYVLFDDNMKLVEGRAVRVSSAGEIAPLVGQMDIQKNGYLYIYISNESPTDVFFDDLTIKHTTGHLLQEDSYYPFGLQIKGLSSVALNRLQNNNLYNGIDKIDEFDLDIYDAPFRNLDPQTGKWWQTDPAQQFANPYVVMGNDPVNGADPSGSISLFDFASYTNTQWATQFTTMAIGSAVGYSTAKNNGLTGNDLALATIGGGITGFAAGHYGYKLGASINYSGIGNSISNFSVNISNGINDIFKGAQNGNPNGWQDLSKSVLMTLAKQYSGKTFTSSGQWEDYVGDTFEDTFHAWANASKNMVGYLNSYTPNTKRDHLDDGEGYYWPLHSSRTHVIIDAKATTTLQNVSSGKTTRFPEAAWFEIKAKQGNITPSTSRGQVAYEMQALVKDQPRAVYEGAAEFNIVTTTNSQVSTKIYVGGYVMGLFVRRWTPQYKIVNKKVKVRFGYEQGTRVGGIPFNITTIFWDDPGVDYQF